MSSYAPPPQHPHGQTGPGVTENERNWAMAAHVGSFIAAAAALGLLAPLLVLLVKGNTSPFVRRHAVESLNFQINALAYTVLFVALSLLLVGIPLLVLYGIFYATCVVLGTVRASNGAEFRYPLTIRLVS